MKTVYRIDWVEYERGWGSRPDGYSLHLSLEEARVFRDEHDYSESADIFTKATEPYMFDVEDYIFEQVREHGSLWDNRIKEESSDIKVSENLSGKDIGLKDIDGNKINISHLVEFEWKSSYLSGGECWNKFKGQFVWNEKELHYEVHLRELDSEGKNKYNSENFRNFKIIGVVEGE